MQRLSLEKPNPDFSETLSVLKGRTLYPRVHCIEVIIDDEIKKSILEHSFNKKNIPPAPAYGTHKGRGINVFSSRDYRKLHEDYYKQTIDFYYRLGYDIIPDHDCVMNFYSLNTSSLLCKDTALISRGMREWAQEGEGLIRCWEDFESFPWARAEEMVRAYAYHLDFMGRHLPEGMTIAVVGAVFAPILGWLLGFEGLFRSLYDDHELVKAVFDKVGALFEQMYKAAAQKKEIGILWHGDDLGYKTSTMISPGHLRAFLFPWMKKYADVAHENGKLFFIHCCGYKDTIMEDFIQDMKCDALHSFEDACCPVTEYKRKYGERVALLGGIDVNVLANAPEENVRACVRKTLKDCMVGGRYMLGSGNSITNYVPVENYLAMLEEGLLWR
jgi:uroporphyrinogen decarboxylase